MPERNFVIEMYLMKNNPGIEKHFILLKRLDFENKV
jgi:hypothetical protein